MPEEIGSRIQKFRLMKKISLSELANRAGVAKSYLSNVERNIQSNPSIHFLNKIANSLDITVEQLLYGKEIKAEDLLDSDWLQLARDAMNSGMSKTQFKELLDFQKWKLKMDEDHNEQ